eukprot:TRINITY_DN20567_c0_g3_i1.p1 TRINITY_DN20567_c0_g3~~TRINITY_DN20567_c0_g3_i1.p1  ORF type:complete len:428 (+),score=101.41 TRINITY_DN20567_c0_g3_i1:105-1388(+)
MLASAVRSLVVVDCEDEAGEGVAAQADSVLRQVRLETPAKAALAWDAASQRIVCPLAGLAGGGDVVTFVSTTNPATQYSALQQHGCSPERVPLPIGCSISDLSLAGRREDGTTWTALSCADGAVRLLDCSAGATPKASATPSAAAKPEGHLRFVCISDTHNLHDQLVLPEGDVLLHTGDFSELGSQTEVANFVDWLVQQKFEHKVVIAGNHDIGVDGDRYDTIGKNWKEDKSGRSYNNLPGDVRPLLTGREGFTYLENDSVEIQGIKIYGSPMTPLIVLPLLPPIAMAFNLQNRAECRAQWSTIPSDTDVLLTHGPPKGFGDGFMKLGCQDLREAVLERVRPAFHVFGHVHEGYGVVQHTHAADTVEGAASEQATLDRNGEQDANQAKAVSRTSTTTFVNASTCTLLKRPSNAPLVFDVAIKSKACD